MNTENKKNSTSFISVPNQLIAIFCENQHANKSADQKLNTTDFFIYLLFLRYYNAEKGYAWISNETIAEKLNKVKRSVDSSVSKLMRCRFIYRYKPSSAQQLANKALYGSYCTRPLIRMTSYDQPLIDERKEYELRIQHSIEMKTIITECRLEKARNSETTALRATESSVAHPELNSFESEIDDDVPF